MAKRRVSTQTKRTKQSRSTAGSRRPQTKKAAKKATKKPTKTAIRKSTKKSAASSAASTRRKQTKSTPGPAEIGADLVRLCNLGRGDDVVGIWYHPRLVSVEGDGTTTRGLKQLADKYAWWDANHEVHALQATGPFVGATGFAVRFDIVVTPKGGARMEMSEIAVYTVRDGKIVREEFMYGS